MSEKEKIKSWKIPTWHKDFGDPKKEISLLKDLCLYILNMDSAYSFEIEYIEEGYLSIQIYKNGNYFGEFQVVDSDNNRTGLFLTNGDEFYLSKKEDIRKYL